MFATLPTQYDEIKDWRWADFAPYAEKLLAGENAVVFMDRFGGTESYVPFEFSDGKWWVS